MLFRNSLFNSLLLDYAAICFRTLGHYPTSPNQGIGGHLSYLLACFIVTCFTYEFCQMYLKSNSQKFLKGDKKSMKKTDYDFKGIIYEGMDLEKISENWFARNYNFLYLLRLAIVCLLIFNLQYNQIVQVIASLVVVLAFSVLTFYNQIKHGIFKSKFTAVLRMIQEASMALILGLVNVFMYDSFNGGLSSKAKAIFVFTFMGLLGLNILLEIAGAVVSVVQLIRKKYCQKKIAKIRAMDKKKIVQNRKRSTKIKADGRTKFRHVQKKGQGGKSGLDGIKSFIRQQPKFSRKKALKPFNLKKCRFVNNGRVSISVKRSSRLVMSPHRRGLSSELCVRKSLFDKKRRVLDFKDKKLETGGRRKSLLGMNGEE